MRNTNLFPHLSAVQPPSPRQNFPSNSQDYNVTLWLSNVIKEQKFGQHSKLGLFCLFEIFFKFLSADFSTVRTLPKHANILILYLGTIASLRARCFTGCIKKLYWTLCGSCFTSTYEQLYWPCMKFSHIGQKGFSLPFYSWLLWPCFSSSFI